MRKAISFIFIFLTLLCLVGCQNASTSVIGGADGPTGVIVSGTQKQTYQCITQEEAKRILDSEEEVVLLDVREEEEYRTGHIPGAINMPHGQIKEKSYDLPENKEVKILVYCRTGRRSKIASETLAELGYEQVLEIGGIETWPYEIVTE